MNKLRPKGTQRKWAWLPGYDATQRWLRAHPRIRLASVAAILFILFFIVSWRILDPDFGWHLQAGNYIRAHGIPAHDIYTYTARQFPWIDHEWGNDVVVSLLYGWGGYGLVAVLYASLWSSALIIASRRARLSVLLLAATAMIPYSGIRAVAWTVFFLAVTCAALRSKKHWAVWLLPLLLMLWANIHAGFITGLAIIGYTALYERRLKLWLVLVLSALATLVNAYGPRLYVEIARTLFDPTLHSQVGEWASFSFTLPVLVFIVLWAAGSFLFEKNNVKLWFRPTVLLLVSAVSATRNVPLFVIVAVRELDGYATSLRTLLPKTMARKPRLVVTAIVICVSLVACYGAYTRLWPLRKARDAGYPIAAVTYLRANGCEGGNLFNDYNFGGYLIWQLPQQPVFIDGRMPSWKDPKGQKYMTNYYQLLASRNYRPTFQKYNIRCSLLQKSGRNVGLINQLGRDGWKTVLQEPTYILQEAPKIKK